MELAIKVGKNKKPWNTLTTSCASFNTVSETGPLDSLINERNNVS